MRAGDLRGQKVLSCPMWVLRTEPGSSAKVSCIFNHWAIATAPTLSSYWTRSSLIWLSVLAREPQGYSCFLPSTGIICIYCLYAYKHYVCTYTIVHIYQHLCWGLKCSLSWTDRKPFINRAISLAPFPKILSLVNCSSAPPTTAKYLGYL